jgi:hypothetical protein
MLRASQAKGPAEGCQRGLRARSPEGLNRPIISSYVAGAIFQVERVARVQPQWQGWGCVSSGSTEHRRHLNRADRWLPGGPGDPLQHWSSKRADD